MFASNSSGAYTRFVRLCRLHYCLTAQVQFVYTFKICTTGDGKSTWQQQFWTDAYLIVKKENNSVHVCEQDISDEI